MANRRGKQLLHQIYRRMAIRVARAYRTVSHTAATILAGMPPMELYAQMYAEIYRRTRELRELGMVLTKETKAALRLQARRRMMEGWNEHLSDHQETSGKRVVEAIRPRLFEWVKRRGGGRTSFRMTQIFTGHGCFGEYLCRIGRERTAQCHHCDDDRDTTQHTLEHCQAWVQERRVLVDIVGNDLSLPGIIAAMLRDERSWMAVSSFCETVMSQKEEAERERERLPNSGRTPSQGRRAGTGRGRRRRPLSRIQGPRTQARPTGAPNTRGAS
ncbi:reverse transcriptase [Lasius niger]|uniref:Reverse transcriptase n=1 Tax=Lasius niger TaxID=67767 RepID=A0A0J7KJB9_LASNI|nr:reverse transcriptase [Lasius niger]